MKKRICLSMLIGLLFVLATCFSAFANGASFPWCTDTTDYCQKKIAQVPIPWQFWGIVTENGNTTVIDRIRLSPTWLNPLPDQSVLMSSPPVFIKRMIARASAPIPLEGLVWDFTSGTPMPDLMWEVADEVPIEIYPGGDDLVLEIPVDASMGAVLVAYEVFMDAYGTDFPMGHFINEAVLQWQSPGEILEIMVNFDIHNGTGLAVDNFELDFQGLDFGCEDVKGAIGYKAAQGPINNPVPIPPVIWGANEYSPLVVGPITGGTEVKWIQPDNPLATSEWLHIGLMFDCTGFDCFNNPDDPTLQATVQGYWSVIEPCTGEVPVDINPMSCPNPLNVKEKGVLPVAILGTENLDVTTIDPATVKLSREDSDVDVSPLRWQLEDVETPFERFSGKESCTEDCHAIGPDGYLDLTLKFKAQEVVAALGEVEDGDCLVLTLTGKLKEDFGGTPIMGEDVVVIVKKGMDQPK